MHYVTIGCIGLVLGCFVLTRARQTSVVKQEEDKLKQYGDSVGANTWLTRMRDVHLYATFPHLLLAEIDRAKTRGTAILPFTKNETAERECWVFKHLDLIRRSPKMQKLREYLNKLQLGEPIPIFTTNPVEAFIVYMWLKYKYKQGKVGLYRAGLDNQQEQKADIIEHFQKPDISDPARQLRFLVGRCHFLGTGVNLTRAFRSILLQPEWLGSLEDQAKGRVWRNVLAQSSKKTYMIRLI